MGKPTCVSCQNQLSPGQRFDHLPIQLWSVLQTCARSPALAASSRHLFLGSYNQWSTIINSSKVQGIPLLLVLYTMGLPLKVSAARAVSAVPGSFLSVSSERESMPTPFCYFFFLFVCFKPTCHHWMQVKKKMKWTNGENQNEDCPRTNKGTYWESTILARAKSNNTERTSTVMHAKVMRKTSSYM